MCKLHVNISISFECRQFTKEKKETIYSKIWTLANISSYILHLSKKMYLGNSRECFCVSLSEFYSFVYVLWVLMLVNDFVC